MCIIFRILFLHIFFCVFSFLCFLFQIYFVFIKYGIALFFAYDLHTFTHNHTHTRYIWTKTTISAIDHRQTHNTAILNVAPQIAQKNNIRTYKQESLKERANITSPHLFTVQHQHDHHYHNTTENHTIPPKEWKQQKMKSIKNTLWSLSVPLISGGFANRVCEVDLVGAVLSSERKYPHFIWQYFRI